MWKELGSTGCCWGGLSEKSLEPQVSSVKAYLGKAGKQNEKQNKTLLRYSNQEGELGGQE